MIAPCGMNCAICYAMQRPKDTCQGCNSDGFTPDYCRRCSIRNCGFFESGNGRFCFACEDFPCKRLKQLDKRYRAKYGMSMVENLDYIKEKGIREFVKSERLRWACPSCGDILNVHRWECPHCGSERPK